MGAGREQVGKSDASDRAWRFWLAVLFRGVVRPVGAILRVVGLSPIALGPDPRVRTYWKARRPIRDPKRHLTGQG
jgi:hypothetical protein